MTHDVVLAAGVLLFRPPALVWPQVFFVLPQAFFSWWPRVHVLWPQALPLLPLVFFVWPHVFRGLIRGRDSCRRQPAKARMTYYARRALLVLRFPMDPQRACFAAADVQPRTACVPLCSTHCGTAARRRCILGTAALAACGNAQEILWHQKAVMRWGRGRLLTAIRTPGKAMRFVSEAFRVPNVFRAPCSERFPPHSPHPLPTLQPHLPRLFFVYCVGFCVLCGGFV